MRISKQGKKKYKMYSLWRKRESGTIMLEPNPGLKQIRSLKKSLIIKCIKGNGAPRAKPHPVKLPTCERELQKA